MYTLCEEEESRVVDMESVGEFRSEIFWRAACRVKELSRWIGVRIMTVAEVCDGTRTKLHSEERVFLSSATESVEKLPRPAEPIFVVNLGLLKISACERFLRLKH